MSAVQKPIIQTEELKAELERSLGFPLRSLERLGGGSTLNFKAVRATDGFTFVVKCSPPSRHGLFVRLLKNMECLRGTKAMRCVFERECPREFRGYELVCLSWCAGASLFPDELSDEELSAFLADYRAFSESLQTIKDVREPRPIPEWREAFLVKSRRRWTAVLHRLTEEVSVEDCAYRPDLLRVTHGDFHHGNFFFENGRVSGYADLEAIRLGYPTDDIIRYFTCAAEHLHWYAFRRRRGVLRRFASVVRQLPYSRHEWMVAINGRFLGKVFQKTHCVGRIGLLAALNLRYRARFYRALRKIVIESTEIGADVQGEL